MDPRPAMAVSRTTARSRHRVGTVLPAVALACAVTCAVTDAHGNPLDMYGFGSRSIALGGAVTADVSDVSANYYNPAGLAAARGLRGEVGYFYVSHALATDGRDNAVDSVHGLTGGVVAPGRLFGMGFAFGLAFLLPDDRLSRVRALPQVQPRWELYDVRVQRLYIGANLAIAPFPWLRLGGGMSFMSSTRGTLDIQGRISVTDPQNSLLTHTVDADLTAVRYPQAGLQIDLGPTVTVGAAWRGEFHLDLSLDAVLAGQIVLGRATDPRAFSIPGTYTLTSHTLAAFQPQQAVGGVVWRFAPGWRVMADLTWVQWSAYENPTSILTVGLDLRIPAGITGLRTPSLPSPAVRVPAGFHDTVVPRVGIEHVHPMGRHALAVRLGYHFDPTPVPDQTGVTNFLDGSRHVVSLGLGVALRHLGAVLPGTLALDAHADYQYVVPRTVFKDSPVDPVGDYTLSGTVLNVGLTATLGFE